MNTCVLVCVCVYVCCVCVCVCVLCVCVCVCVLIWKADFYPLFSRIVFKKNQVYSANVQKVILDDRHKLRALSGVMLSVYEITPFDRIPLPTPSPVAPSPSPTASAPAPATAAPAPAPVHGVNGPLPMVSGVVGTLGRRRESKDAAQQQQQQQQLALPPPPPVFIPYNWVRVWRENKRERENNRERERDTERERDRERQRENEKPPHLNLVFLFILRLRFIDGYHGRNCISSLIHTERR